MAPLDPAATQLNKCNYCLIASSLQLSFFFFLFFPVHILFFKLWLSLKLMFEGFFWHMDLVYNLIIPWILLGEYRAKEKCEVKGRLAMASKFKLWFHLESINSKMLKDYTCCGSTAVNLQGMREKRWTLLFLWNLLNTHTDSVPPCSNKMFLMSSSFDIGLLQRFSSSRDFCLNKVPSNGVCQN